MRIRAVFVAGMVALSGCMTSGLDKPGNAGLSGAPAVQPDDTGAVAATIISAMGGGLIGGAIGTSLDEADRRMALEAEYRALEYTPAGQGVTWKGANSNRSGEVIAAQPYRVGSQDCRQYSHAVSLDGHKQTARGTACRNADGSWTPLT